MRNILILAAALLLLGGCYSKEVRHLASDASLVRPGITTKKDLYRYLGEPNGRRTISPQEVEYVYYEDLPGFLGHMPVVSSWTGTEGYEMIVIKVKDDVVTLCEFRTFKESDQDWVDDFTWEEVK
ncbi:MAG: hypothetical protein CSB34_04505 [Desulfobulbus propionicus]|nr:MAG: hypothetical protein CSB34_04505 [Desulfobulbus propionicus]